MKRQAVVTNIQDKTMNFFIADEKPKLSQKILKETTCTLFEHIVTFSQKIPQIIRHSLEPSTFGQKESDNLVDPSFERMIYKIERDDMFGY